MVETVTPRPPLNLALAVRINVDDTPTGVLVYDVPIYRIPAEGPRPERFVESAAILTNVIIANTTEGPAAASLWVIDNETNQFYFVVELPIAENGYVKVDLDKQILRSGEKLYVSLGASQTAQLHLSFVLYQREEFTVIGA